MATHTTRSPAMQAVWISITSDMHHRVVGIPVLIVYIAIVFSIEFVLRGAIRPRTRQS